MRGFAIEKTKFYRKLIEKFIEIFFSIERIYRKFIENFFV